MIWIESEDAKTFDGPLAEFDSLDLGVSRDEGQLWTLVPERRRTGIIHEGVYLILTF